MNIRENPYVGPAALFEGISIYGRAAEIEDLIDLLISARIVLLYSPSGAGKTSLIQAGLLKALREEHRFSVSLVKGFGGQHEGNRYLANLYDVLECPLPDNLRTSPSPQSTTLDAYLKKRPMAPQEGPQTVLHQAVSHTSDDEPEEPAGHIFIFDQFEEIFTLDAFDRAAKAEFFQQVGQALKNRTRCALFSMREDHIAELDDYLHFLPTQLKTRYRLGLLDRIHAREAIEGPAREKGVRYEAGAADMLVSELCKIRKPAENGKYQEIRGNFVEPVQLQVVCYRLWERLYIPPASNEAVAASGNAADPQADDPDAAISQDEVRQLSVDKALEQFYDDKVKEAAAAANASEGDIRPWFERELIMPNGIRGQVLRGEEKSGGLPREVIKHLEDAHLVRLETRGDNKWYELAHDRLVSPIRSSNAAWRRGLAPLQRATLEWESQGRRKDVFLSPAAWMQSWLWVRLNRSMVRPSEMNFLRHSGRSILHIYVPMVALVMAVLFILVRLHAFNINKAAEKRSEDLLKISSGAYRAQIDAMQRTMNHALVSSSMVAKSYQDLTDPEVRQTVSSIVRETLFTTLRNATDIRTLLVGDNTMLQAVAFHPSRSEPIFAYGGQEGMIVLAGTESGILRKIENVCTENESKGRAINALAFNGSGNLLAIGCENGDVVVWNTSDENSLRDWGERSRWTAHQNTQAVAFNAGGGYLASGGFDNEIKVMSVSPEGRQLSESPDKLDMEPSSASDVVATILSLAFSPTENKLAAGDSKSHLWLCEIERSKKCKPAAVPQVGDGWDRTRALAFTADGKQIVSGHLSGRLLRWEAAHTIHTPEPLIEIPRPSPVFSVTVFDKKAEGEEQKRTYVAFGADGLRHVPLIPANASRQSQFQRSALSSDEVVDTAFHAPTGLLAAVTRSGYVAVMQTQEQLSHVTLKHTADKVNAKECPAGNALAIGLDPVAATENTHTPTQLLASGCGNLQLLQVRENQLRVQQTIPAEEVGQGRIIKIAAGDSMKTVATLGENHTVKFWKLDKELVEDDTIPPLAPSVFTNNDAGFSPEKIQQIILSPNGKWLVATFDGSGSFLLVNLHSKDNQKVRTVKMPFNVIHALAVDFDSNLLAAAGSLPERTDTAPDYLELWNFNNGQPIRQKDAGSLYSMNLPYPSEKASTISIMAKGSGQQRVVVGTMQGKVVVWDASARKQIKQVDSDSAAEVFGMAVAPAQQLIAAVNDRGKITLWDARSWDRLVLTNARFEKLRQAELAGFTPDGKYLVSFNNELTVWRLDVNALHRKVCQILGRERNEGIAGASREVIAACEKVVPAQR